MNQNGTGGGVRTLCPQIDRRGASPDQVMIPAKLAGKRGESRKGSHEQVRRKACPMACRPSAPVYGRVRRGAERLAGPLWSSGLSTRRHPATNAAAPLGIGCGRVQREQDPDMQSCEENVYRIADHLRERAAQSETADPSLLLIAAFLAASGEVHARRAEWMLSLFEAADPSLSGVVAKAKHLALLASSIAAAAAAIEGARE